MLGLFALALVYLFYWSDVLATLLGDARASHGVKVTVWTHLSYDFLAPLQIKASEMLVAPRISECFGMPWSAIVCPGLQYCTFGNFGTFSTLGTIGTFGTFGTLGTFGFF